MKAKRWKLTVNYAVKSWDEKPKECWGEIEQFITNRGGHAKLEYQDISIDMPLKELLSDWTIYAEIEG